MRHGRVEGLSVSDLVCLVGAPVHVALGHHQVLHLLVEAAQFLLQFHIDIHDVLGL